MAAYTYKALTGTGKVSKGVLEGDSERHVRKQLRIKKLQPIDVSPVSQVSISKRLAQSSQSISSAELTLLTRQLATLIQSGVPLDEALSATAQQAMATGVKNLLMQIRSKVLSGQSLASSLSAFPQTFPHMYQAMVRAGEHAGLLGEVLEQLAEYNERRSQLQQKLQMALIYPLVLICIASSVIGLLMVFVMPELVGLFEQTDTPLPMLTRILIAISAFLGAWWWLLLMLLIVALLGMQKLLRSHARIHVDALLLRLPLAGRLLKSSDTARFVSTLSILMKSGVVLTDAITIAAQVMSNQILREQTAKVAQAVEEGGSLAGALEQSTYFPPLLLQLVASGESSGKLEAMLEKAAYTQELELELQLNMLVKIMEPLVIVVMAVVVGAIVLSVLLPVMQMNTLIT